MKIKINVSGQINPKTAGDIVRIKFADSISVISSPIIIKPKEIGSEKKSGRSKIPEKGIQKHIIDCKVKNGNFSNTFNVEIPLNIWKMTRLFRAVSADFFMLKNNVEVYSKRDVKLSIDEQNTFDIEIPNLTTALKVSGKITRLKKAVGGYEIQLHLIRSDGKTFYLGNNYSEPLTGEYRISKKINERFAKLIPKHFKCKITICDKGKPIEPVDPQFFDLILGDNKNKNVSVPAIVLPPKETTISGKVNFYQKNTPAYGYNVKLSTKQEKKTIELGNSSIDEAGHYFIKIEDIKLDILPKTFTCDITILSSEGSQPILNISPDSINLSKEKNKDLDIVLNKPIKRNYDLEFKFIDKETQSVFKDKLELIIYLTYDNGSKKLLRHTSNGKLKTSTPIITLSHAVFRKIDIDIVDNFKKRTALSRKIAGNTLYDDKINKFEFKLEYKKEDPYPQNSIELIRPKDLLLLKFDFKYLEFVNNEKIFKPVYKGKPGLMIVTLPPQSFAEEAFFESDPQIPILNPKDPDYDAECDPNSNDYNEDYIKVSDSVSNPPVQSRISGSSRLAFIVNNNESIVFSEEGLLNALSVLTPKLVPVALLPDPEQSDRINDSQTETIQLEQKPEILSTFKELLKINSAREKDLDTLTLSSSEKNFVTRLIEEDQELSKYLNLLFETDEQFKDSIALPPNILKAILTSLREKYPLKIPESNETSIETPFRLLISPSKNSAWQHNITCSQKGIVELWHSRLIYKGNPNNNELNTIRAIWSIDWEQRNYPTNESSNEPNSIEHVSIGHHYIDKEENNEIINPFRLTIDAYDRENIVHLTSNFIKNGNKLYQPKPVYVKNLMLTSLGAISNFRGTWSPPDSLSVEEWLHRSTLGRDQFVKVVYKGYLFPFGHRASLVKVTERKFEPAVENLLSKSVKLVKTETNELIAGEYKKVASEVVLNIEGKTLGDVPAILKSFGNKVVELGTKLRKSKTVSDLEEEHRVKRVFNDNMRNLIASVIGSISFSENGSIALLKQRMFIVIREPEKVYLSSGNESTDRRWPFAKIQVKTLITPNLDKPENSEIVEKEEPEPPKPKGYGQSMFWPKVGKNYFYFQFEATDFEGNKSEFCAPIIFVENSVAREIDDKYPTSDAQEDYAQEDNRNSIHFQGQSIFFTEPELGNDPLKTTFETNTITFTADINKLYGKGDNPYFYPQIKEAKVIIPALKVLIGDSSIITMQYWDHYAINGFDKNKNVGEVFAKVTESPMVNFSAHGDKVGGLIQPNLKITGLSRFLGPVGGTIVDPEPDPDIVTDNLANGKFCPDDFFIGSGAKIFGAIALWNILGNVEKFTNASESLPKLVTESTNGQSNVNFNWKPVLKENGIFIPNINGATIKDDEGREIKPIASMFIDTSVSLVNGIKTFESHSVLKLFTIDLLGNSVSFIKIRFIKIEFNSIEGEKPYVDVQLANIDEHGIEGVEFTGVLSFVKTLVDRIPMDGFSEKPYLDVNEKGITSGFSLSVPDLTIGVFTLQNLSLAAAFTIPFINDPLSLRFSFCERQNPFLLTVSMFGGGGYFGITINPAGVQMLEAAFEFGASVSMNFGVASGGVSVMAGIYFKMTMQEPKTAELTGYFELNGNVRVLGIVNINIEIYLGLKYDFSSKKCIGRAVIIVEVDVCLFSKSVEITCEKKFKGSNSDPTFAELMDSYESYDSSGNTIKINPWEEYWAAYAI